MDSRVEKKQVYTYKMKAEARISILRKTRYLESGKVMFEMTNYIVHHFMRNI